MEYKSKNRLRGAVERENRYRAVEWKLGGQPSGNDLAQDPDTDTLKNADEMLMHTDLKIADASKLSVTGYRYDVQKDGPVNDQGQQCFTFRRRHRNWWRNSQLWLERHARSDVGLMLPLRELD